MITAQVCLPLPIPKVFTYLSPEILPQGAMVLVPFGKKHLWGIVWQCAPEASPTISPHLALKTILRVHPFITLSPSFLSFLQSMATYIVSPLGNILKMVLPDIHPDRLLLLQPFPFLKGQTGLYWCSALLNKLLPLLPEPSSEEIGEATSPLTATKQMTLAFVSSLPLAPLKTKEALDIPSIPFLSPSWAGTAFERFYQLHKKLPCTLTQTLEEMASVKAPPSFWQKQLNLSWPQVKKLICQGVLLPVRQEPQIHPSGHILTSGMTTSSAPILSTPPQSHPLFSIYEKTPLILSSDQKNAYDAAQSFFSSQSFVSVLLEGVTGSGKTEVALALCKEVWARGQQVLVLLPEIALSAQWMQRSETYFACHPGKEYKDHNPEHTLPLAGLWHSGLSLSARQQTFEGLTQGTLPLIIGARSALCLPYRNLGLIIVDEEHDTNYKQTEGVLYHGRDMAINRAFHEKIPVLLLSATPSLEVLKHVQEKKYAHIQLTSRYGQALLPQLHLIDRRSQPPKEGAWISASLRRAMEETLARKEQSLLFLNRRGFACLLLCFQCGWREECPHCSVWLSVHTHREKRLVCHYCGFTKPVPQECTQCGHSQALTPMGAGIEKIQQEVLSFMPDARVALFSSDHVPSPEALTKILTQIVQGEIDVIIGTQILAKGHHFPRLSCIGIIDADAALENIDFRNRERLFQLLSQVSGRAGRGETKGHAYIQTLFPHDPFFTYLVSYQRDLFLQHELERRKQENLPPFSRCALITLSGASDPQVQETALTLQKTMTPPLELTVWGPAPAPLSPLRARYRWRFILKAPRSFPLQKWIQQCLTTSAPLSKNVQVTIDIDPYNFL